MTPATASLPYWAPAPSRRISIWSMAPGGIALTSTGTMPAKLLSVSSTALAWRRLPLTSTSTWSGARPRSWMPRTESAAPLDSMRGKLIDGASSCKAAPRSPLASAFSTSRAPKRSIGTALSNTVRLRAREPTTVTWSMVARSTAGAW